MIRLYIENNEMDVTEGFSHQITYAVDDLNNLDSKATSFSKTIVLPGTAKNNYLLGNIFEFSNSNFTGVGANVAYNFNASRSAKCRLEINGLQIIKGVLRLLEIIRDGDSIEYEVAIFGELGGFINNLGNKKLTDLNFNPYNHFYNYSTIYTNYWDNASEYKFYTSDETILINGSVPQIQIFENITDYVEVGDTIKVVRRSDGANYGFRTVISVNLDGQKTIIQVSSNWAITPSSSFACEIGLLNKKGFGIYYPLIDYGNYSTNKHNYKFKTFRPALHVYEYIDKIIKGAGYTWESKFFKTDFFKRLIVPHNESVLNTLKQDVFGGNFYGWFYSPFPGQYKNIQISQIYGDLFSTTDDLIYTYNGSTTTLNLTGIINLNDIYVLFPDVQVKGYIYLFKNGVQYGPEITYYEAFGTYSHTWLTFNINREISINNGDYIEFRLVTTSGSAVFGYAGNGFSGTINLYSQYPLVTKVNYGDVLEMSQCIPKNILQKDFFASILKMFYLMVTEDKYKEKHLKIEPWTWFYDLNSSSYIDWSLKLDRSQPIRIKPMSEANSRYYDIKFKSDTDYFNDFYKKRYNEGYGDVRYDNQLEFSKDAQSTEVIFASTPLLGYVGEEKIVPSIFKWDGKVVGVNEETVNSNIRILQKKAINEINEWSVLNDTGGIYASYTKYPYAGHFDDPDVPNSDINFGATKELFFDLRAGALGNNLFNTFYSSYLAEITDKDSRLVTAKFKLNDTDIFNLDFGKFIYLDGVLYRLSKIVDYTPGEICTVELLRVIYTTYDNSVNASDDPEVTINDKIWKVRNLDTEFYRNGDIIPQITDNTEWADATEGAWCYYRNKTENDIEYGKLYNWFAVNDPRGLAPEGYHIATVAEYTDMFSLNSNAYAWKESGTTHWNTDNGTDLYGFKALGGGVRDIDGSFSDLKSVGVFWTADEYNDSIAYYFGIDDTSSTIIGDKGDKNYGLSVRLVKD